MSDHIDKPSHYRQLPVECVQVAEHFNYLLGNVIKYVWRHQHKGDPATDLKKARWYLDREIERRENIDKSREFANELAEYAALAGESKEKEESEKNELPPETQREIEKFWEADGWQKPFAPSQKIDGRHGGNVIGGSREPTPAEVKEMKREGKL